MCSRPQPPAPSAPEPNGITIRLSQDAVLKIVFALLSALFGAGVLGFGQVNRSLSPELDNGAEVTPAPIAENAVYRTYREP